MPAVEYQITLTARELASVLAGLRLLDWLSGPDRRLLPYHVARMADDITSDAGANEPLSDVELAELMRRLG